MFKGSRSDAVQPVSGAAEGTPEFAYAGSLAEVTKDIPADGIGEVELGGSFWRATCTEAVEKGARIRVKGPTSRDLLLLEVEVIAR